ncbi:MAG TPA: type I phosphomannose isomerase catalytic subunit [Lacunisphaera sp.]|nr:type I phosphomannose isomerase catalytic subunit [Lacunisphaera sp.]
MSSFLQFKPVYQERVWGGRTLASFLGRALPGEAPIGESWEIVDRDEAQSVVADGRWTGKSLRELLHDHASEIMGPTWTRGHRFPILVKWLDCRDRLSVQVHPPASIAAKLGGEPKTENWFIAQADDGAAVYAGLRPGVTRERFEKAIAAGTVEHCLERLAVRAGDSLLIHSGTMHAIDAGNMILEIQQNSDTTYRVYDWGRMGLDGKPRQLHVRESLECLAANTAPAPHLLHGPGLLVDSPLFTLRRVDLSAGATLAFAAREQPRILSLAAGALDGDGALRMGDNVLLPFEAAFRFRATVPSVVLVTERFT